MPPPEPRTPEGAAALRELLAHPESAVIALDYDGTLAPIVARPEDARPSPGVVPNLVELSRCVGAVVIITGRPAGQVVALAELAAVEGLERLVILGQYGRERWDAATGEVVAPPVPQGVEEVRRKLPLMLAEAPDGVTIEDKGSALVVHTRQAAEPAVALGRLQGPLAALAERHGLVVEPARLAAELRPPGYDKGRALRGAAADHDAHVVVFVGDDLGDVPAYDAVEDLRSDGRLGLTVCSASDEVPELRERADLVLDGPAGVLGFLNALVEQLVTADRS